MSRRWLLAWLPVLLLVLLTGCGRKGSVEPPEGEESRYPRRYPRE